MKKVDVVGLNKAMCYHSFAFLEKVGKQFKIAESFGTCRTYMADCIYSIKTGVNYRKFVVPVDLKKGNTYIGLCFFTKEQKDVFIKNLPYLHKKEEQAKVKKTVLYETDNPRILVAEGSVYWKRCAWSLQLYTFYLKRLGFTEIEGSELSYWKGIKKGNNEAIMLSKVKKELEVFEKSVYGPNLSMGIHSYTGFVSITSGCNEPMRKLLGLEKV